MTALSLPVLVPVWLAPTVLFVVALAVALGAAARFTLELEAAGDHWKLSPGLLSFVSALGANIPNYVASLAAFASGHGAVGLGIIIGSNIYNLAVVLGLVTFATPGRRGITFTRPAMRDVRRVAALAAAMSVTTLLTFLVLPPQSSLARAVPPVVVAALGVLTLGIFLGVIVHALQRVPHPQPLPRPRPRASDDDSDQTTQDRLPRRPRTALARALARVLLALAIALLGVIVMVASGQAAAADMHLSPVLLSFVVLAVATSLPNTVVAYELARTERASTSVEEILSSNSINLALGSAFPLLLWRAGLLASPQLRLDMALLCVLSVVVLAQVHVRRIPRPVGASLLGLYILWVLIHVAT